MQNPKLNKKTIQLALTVIICVFALVETVYSITTTFEAPTDTTAAEVKSAHTGTQYYEVERVVDGDTVVLKDFGKVRLIGIDTPEVVDPRKEVQCYGQEASDKAKELLTGKSVRIEYDETQDTADKYGRALVYLFIQSAPDGREIFFNKLMIEQGFAYEYTYKVPYKYQEEFKAAQQEARTTRVGLWGDACPR